MSYIPRSNEALPISLQGLIGASVGLCMTKLASLFALSSLALIGCVTGDNAEAPADDPDPVVTPRVYPASCAQLAARDPGTSDGEKRMYLDGDRDKPWKAYCLDMDSASPKTYLSLPASMNWSEFQAGGRAVGVTVRTEFDKVRIDPATLTIDPDDLTFATSTGSIVHPTSGDHVEAMPFGIGMTCGGSYATANVSFEGTPFFLVDNFHVTGDAGATGHAELWWTGQTEEMWTDGDCGIVGPQGTVQLTYGQQP